MSSTSSLYNDVIMDHIKNARNYRELAEANRRAEGINPLCGDTFTIYVQVEDMVGKCELVKSLGGKIAPGFPFNRSDGAGCIALFSDPSGHPMGMFSRTPLPATK